METLPGYEAQLPNEALDTMVDRVALGRLVVVVGESVRERLGGSVRAVPVHGYPATQLVLAWLPDARSAASRLTATAQATAAGATHDRLRTAASSKQRTTAPVGHCRSTRCVSGPPSPHRGIQQATHRRNRRLAVRDHAPYRHSAAGLAAAQPGRPTTTIVVGALTIEGFAGGKATRVS